MTFDPETIASRLRELAFLNNAVTINFWARMAAATAAHCLASAAMAAHHPAAARVMMAVIVMLTAMRGGRSSITMKAC